MTKEEETPAVAGGRAQGRPGSGRGHSIAWESALAAWDTVLALAPGHPEALAGRLECVMRLKRWDDALSAYQAAEAALGVEDRMRIARKFAAARQYEKALLTWQQIVQQVASHEHALTAIRGQLQCFAKLGLTNQRPLVDRQTLPIGSSGKAVQRHEPRTANCNPRHVAILGVSYCGSTLLSLVLGALPGVANIGESHWLLEPRSGKAKDAYNLTAEGFEQCAWCGAQCPVITDALRRRLADDPHGFYQILAEAHQADTIVTADKNYPHFIRRDPGLHNDAIIAFRHPLGNWRSHARRSGTTDDAARLAYLENWAVAYTNFLDNFPNTGRTIAVDCDMFLAGPEKGLQSLCGALDLPFLGEALSYWRTRQHCIGGNREVRQSLAKGDASKLEIRPRAASAADSRASSDSLLPAEVLLVYQRLQRHACRSNGSLAWLPWSAD